MRGIGSEVLYTMLLGPNAVETANEILIPNRHGDTADVFKIVVEFLYSDRAPSTRPWTTKLDGRSSVWRPWMNVEQSGVPQLAPFGAVFRDAVRDGIRSGKQGNRHATVFFLARIGWNVTKYVDILAISLTRTLFRLAKLGI
ncbi:hypothetical protein RvY_15172-1 [Ramazzottius varieornatus]|uniref:BTB domain-containing protein n=1 Tax=Ramazzottius varieornatus TaxID=947166 RepID=A0A1D1VVL3_RAMVA|nr:hypothetical protein RvY_15172-1 [Ramazzottius varieornatus]